MNERVFCSFAVQQITDNRIGIIARGEIRDPTLHPLHLEINGNRNLSFELDRRRGGSVVRLILDV